ncbi:hypothetical protein Tco_1350746, partial [Tanacetum coccineum]
MDALVRFRRGDIAFLRKKVKSGAAVGKLVLLRCPRQGAQSYLGFVFSHLISFLVIIIMANLPPPNNDLNVPKNEHAPAPEHAPIAPNPTPIQPNDYLADDEEDPKEEPEEEEEPIHEQAPTAPAGFAPQWIGWQDPNNNNGWLDEDDDEEPEEDKVDKDDGEEEEMEIDDEIDNPEVINPDKAEKGKLPLPIPVAETEAATVGTGRL